MERDITWLISSLGWLEIITIWINTHLLADALGLDGDGPRLLGLLGPGLLGLFLLLDELLVDLVELPVDFVLQLLQLLFDGPLFAGSVTSVVARLVRGRRRMLRWVIVLDRVGDNANRDVLADLLGNLLASLVVDGLADGPGMRRADLVPDSLAFLLLGCAFLLPDEGALRDGDGPALGLHDELALLLVLCLADLVGDPLARPVKQ